MEERNIEAINKTLMNYQKKWFFKTCQPWIKTKPKDNEMKKYMKGEPYSYSQPFCTGLCKNVKSPLIMFVGQETNGWGKIEDFAAYKDCKMPKDTFESSQQDTIRFTFENFYNDNDKNHSTFWAFINDIKNRCEFSFDICWNNLDKIHYSSKGEACITLYSEDEDYLNGKTNNSPSLLKLEIETIKPEAIIFLTGPSYQTSMAGALRPIQLNKPTLSAPVSEFEYNGRPCAWTYHPTYLRTKAKQHIRTDVPDELVNFLNKYCKK